MITILVIDGHDEDRSYVVERLKIAFPDYRIVEADTGDAGCDILRREGAHCIVLELDLPDRSGFQILIDVVPLVNSPEVPVIVLTRVPNRDVWELARTNGAHACLLKSKTSGDELARVVQTGLARIPPAKGEEPKRFPHACSE
ncbi:hypothetical protein W02_24600 [Nitrospira sp. KM1]|uniref:response regulator n=1 Tax=Nitrospira sp. KM1 TaxID=1936990 RepID=UPI0013A71500|nr:response regulator [Nitrospira sp. KM1]BCA55320.1 hypothetical protein W02_24600 [Nitrospira sp. KM1]